MGNVTPEQARQTFDSINAFLVVFAVFITIIKIVFVVLLFVLVIKAIKYFNNKNKYDCATCIYKQRCTQQELVNVNQDFPLKDG